VANALAWIVAGGGRTPLNTGLIGYYRFEEASGANDALDSSGNGRTLTQVNSPGSAVGKLNNCRTFDGDAFRFTRPDETALRFSGDFTFTCWVYLNGLTVDQEIMSKYNSGAPNDEAVLFYKHNDGLVYIELFDQADNTVFVGCSTFGALSASTFYFVAVRRTGSTLAISINGGAENTVSTSTLTSPIGGTAPFIIGELIGGGNVWNGKIDEVAYYNRALIPTDIGLLYNGGAGRDPVSNP
jgi:Concanavalin A-like lectin/glucanases superfamily